jgi:hypothetical protein
MNSALEEVWSAREEISKACDYDVKKLIAYYQERQQEHQDRLMYLPRKHPVFVEESAENLVLQ